MARTHRRNTFHSFPPSRSSPPSPLSRFFRVARPGWIETAGLRIVGLWLVGVGTVVGIGWGAGVVHRRAQTMRAQAPITVHIQWPTLDGGAPAHNPAQNQQRSAAQAGQPVSHEPTTWIAPAFQEQIAARIRTALAGQVLDARVLARLGETLAASGWFDGKPHIERTADDQVTIAGTWRRPACVLRSGEKDFVIDWQGRPLPIEYQARTSGLPALLGVASEPLTTDSGAVRVDVPWPGEDVRVGLGLLGPLLSEPFAGQVAAVDVHRYFTEGQISIFTDRGNEIVWGGRYGEYIPGEASSDEKLARLRRMYNNTQFGRRIDMGQKRIEIFDERYFALDLSG